MELRAETLNQGEAFLRAVRQGWPELLESPIPESSEAAARGLPGGRVKAAGDPVPRCARPGIGGEVPLPIAAGACCAAAAIPLAPALTAYLHAFAANIVSAALRCISIGQSDGLAVQATEQALAASLDDIGSAAPMLDWLSATHETQYSRLFRS